MANLKIKDENGNWVGIASIQGEPGSKGDPGAPGQNGKDGTSCTHSWDGTILSITSASGTSSANLKGEPGEPGANGKDGTNGKDGVTPTFEVGTVTTGEANVEMTSEDNHYKLNFTFPKGGEDAPEPLNFIGKTSLSNPLILNDLEPGFYLTDDPSGYFYIKLTGNESSSAMVGAIDLLLKIHKKPSEAEENETIASAIFTDFRLIEVKKVSTGTGGVSVVYNSNGRPSFVSSDKNQTISGTKTFSKLPESSQTPTTANQLVNKSYVDNAISSIVNGDEVSY